MAGRDGSAFLRANGLAPWTGPAPAQGERAGRLAQRPLHQAEPAEPTPSRGPSDPPGRSTCSFQSQVLEGRADGVGLAPSVLGLGTGLPLLVTPGPLAAE